MESLKDFLDSLIRATRERFLNPLYVAFIVSWTVINYEVVLILLGSDSAAEKIQFIDSVLFPHDRDVVINGIVRPLVAALAYVLLSPYIYRSVTKYAREREKETVRQLLVVAEETPLSPDAAERIRLNARLASAKAKQEREGLETEIEDLNGRLSSAMDENERLRKALSNGPTKDASDPDPQNDSSAIEKPTESGNLSEEEEEEEEETHPEPTEQHELPASAEQIDNELKINQRQANVVSTYSIGSKNVRFSPDDFPGYGPKERYFLVERGLSSAELNFLYTIRNVPVLTVNRLIETKQFDFNDAKTMLDLFERMSLLESKQYREKGIPVVGYALTGIARMALFAAKSRGILPAKSQGTGL